MKRRLVVGDVVVTRFSDEASEFRGVVVKISRWKDLEAAYKIKMSRNMTWVCILSLELANISYSLDPKALAWEYRDLVKVGHLSKKEMLLQSLKSK